MRQKIFISILAVIVLGVMGCSNKADIRDFEELYDGKVEDGTEVRILGKVAFFYEVDQENVKNNDDGLKFEMDGPTQMIALVNENSKAMHVYNEIDITGMEVVKKDEEVIVEGKIYNVDGTVVPDIQATKVEGTD